MSELDDYVGRQSGASGWQQPAPLTEFAIPESAAPGTPGFFFTTDIPAELSAYYSPAAVVAARLGYTTDVGKYWYEAILATGIIACGWVRNAAVYETFQQEWAGGWTNILFGLDATQAAQIKFGPAAGSSVGSVEFRNMSVFFTSAFMQTDETVRLNGDVTHMPVPGSADFPMYYGWNSEVVTGPAGTNTFNTPVVFPFPFPVGVEPVVTAHIDSTAGATARWHVRPWNVNRTGFEIFGFSSDGGIDTWSHPIKWGAFVGAS